ncbi:serine hydrolase domain-containing protein [Halorussus halobius]|uniref:serine hydrolase domain-containing protein n=1 Tax=Halorussus halobius TaxID=1710537 RepID=UPI0010922BF2|nr:serine hydrolase domain-containing protein [Halorussus halobius]
MTGPNRAEYDADDPLDSLLSAGVVAEVYPGAVAAVGSSDGVDRLLAVGEVDPERGAAATPNTVFDAASLTKPVVTATVVLSLVERGVLAMADPIGAYVPALDGRERGEIPLDAFLTHTSGLRPYAFSEAWETPDEAFADLYSRDLLEAPPGERVEYSCLNYVHLADVASRATGRPFPELARDLVFDPAGMTDSRVGSPPADVGSVAPTFDREYRNRTLRGEIHDPIAWKLAGASGNAGLFTTATDLARFARALLDGGGVLSAGTVAALSTDRTPELDEPRGLGWKLVRGGSAPLGWSTDAVGHTGYTGTSLWIDLARDRFGVLLTNEVYHGKNGGIVDVRRRFRAIVASGRY